MTASPVSFLVSTKTVSLLFCLREKLKPITARVWCSGRNCGEAYPWQSLLHNVGQTVQPDPRAIVSALTLGGLGSIMSCQRLSSLAIMQKDPMHHVSEPLEQLKEDERSRKFSCWCVALGFVCLCHCNVIWARMIKTPGQLSSKPEPYLAQWSFFGTIQGLMPTTKLALFNIMQLNSK